MLSNTPKGFLFSSAGAGFKCTHRDDIGLILSQAETQAAGVFTSNKFQAAPVAQARNLLQASAQIQGILVNAGQANACTGESGLQDCRRSLSLVENKLSLPENSLLPASTGVIGERMDLGLWANALQELQQGLKYKSCLDVAKAMLTTDTFPKIAWRKFELEGKECRIMGLAKGSGMICPHMATMLVFVFCDCFVPGGLLQESLARLAEKTFNRISIDGDSSTNDCLLALANGASGARLSQTNKQVFLSQAEQICQELAYLIVQDAEGGTKILHINICGARDAGQAEAAARSIAHSPLVKTAFFGEDVNWGRIIAALGRSGADFDPNRVNVDISGIPVYYSGEKASLDLDSLLAPHMRRKDIWLNVQLNAGHSDYQMLTSDLSLDYIRINASYRS